MKDIFQFRIYIDFHWSSVRDQGVTGYMETGSMTGSLQFKWNRLKNQCSNLDSVQFCQCATGHHTIYKNHKVPLCLGEVISGGGLQEAWKLEEKHASPAIAMRGPVRSSVGGNLKMNQCL